MNIETTVFNDITNLSKNLFNTYNKKKRIKLNDKEFIWVKSRRIFLHSQRFNCQKLVFR